MPFRAPKKAQPLDEAALYQYAVGALARQMRKRVDPVEPHGIEFVQWLELRIRVPPAMSQLAEFLKLVGIGVDHVRIALKHKVRNGQAPSI